MYIPVAFAMSDQAVLAEFIRQHSFGLLISTEGGEPFATHLPLLFDPATGPNGTLRGHLARSNPHARMLAGRSVLAVFSGPHAYVSPTWYQAADTVPTWNYVAVHAYGVCEVIEDTDQILPVLADTVAIYEAGMPTPWQFRPDEAHSWALAAGVVGVRVPVDRLEGKWKLNQNHPPDRQARVATELERSTDPSAREVAALMRANLSRQS